MRLILLVFVVVLLAPIQETVAAEQSGGQLEPCRAAKAVKAGANVASTFNARLNKAFVDDPIKVNALLYAFQLACRADLADLTPSSDYLELIDLLSVSREQYESSGVISPAVLSKLEAIGVTKQEYRVNAGKTKDWQLIIDAKAKAKMRVRPASVLASNGYLFVEAYHQLSAFAELQSERKVFLDVIERSAAEILKYPDENGDGRFGWGRVWFKGRDGLLLHSSITTQNMYFGGYTYFPRVNINGQSTCETSLPLKEELFDHGHNVMFLLEAFLVTRDLYLATRIIKTVGKSFDDTFDEGANDQALGSNGWYYWKQVGIHRQNDLVECEVGREIKNTNLRMGLALLTYSQVLNRNHEQLKRNPELAFVSAKYLRKAGQVIATNNNEIFYNNNFGYQGVHSRVVELSQQLRAGRLVYDRTQITTKLETPLLHSLRNIIKDGNNVDDRNVPDIITICSGDATSPMIDRDIAGSCWNHLAFEAEDYFRIARFTDAWTINQQGHLHKYLDAIARNLAAAKVIHDGRISEYAHYFPLTAAKGVTNDVVNAAYYGFFCMARNIVDETTNIALPLSHRQFFEGLSHLCNDAPLERSETGVTWKKGYKFYELYLTADRFKVPVEDWLLKYKT